jgi:hypothetical protein
MSLYRIATTAAIAASRGFDPISLCYYFHRGNSNQRRMMAGHCARWSDLDSVITLCEGCAMAQRDSDKNDDIKEVLINAVEVELALLKAGVSFWSLWVEHTSKFVKSASSSLSTIRSGKKNANQILLELVDSSREAARTMTELPRSAAEGFLRELDAVASKNSKSPRRAAQRRARAKP